MARLQINNLHKSYGTTKALSGINLDIADGAFTVFVGPSGCGKSTLLRTIAGLESISEGTITIGDDVVNQLRPKDRDIAMVFQNYALYPYMNVFENIAFGLRARKFPSHEIEQKVHAAAQLLEIESLLERQPRQLSGGQRQRVAIGRAIVRDARLYLFDEPLSNLDAQLREGMRGEFKKLHERIGKTMVYVTHDQMEAMTLADTIVLLRDGVVEQIGSPLDLFERPVNRFVAGFLGSPSINFVPATVEESSGSAMLRFAEGQQLALPEIQQNKLRMFGGKEIICGIRPEQIALATDSSLQVPVDIVQPTGSRTFATFQLSNTAVVAELSAHSVTKPGELISIAIDADRIFLIDPTTDNVL